MLEEYFHGENRNKPHDTRSAAKSLTSALVGAAIHAGVPLDVSAPVYKVMNGGEVPGGLDPRKANLRLEHLLTMSSGLDCDDGDPKSPGYEDFMLGQHAQPDFYQFMLALNMLRVLVGRSSSFRQPVFIWGPEVIAFLRFRPELLSLPDKHPHAFPHRVPGSLSRILDSLDSQSNPSIEHEVIAGAVGPAPRPSLQPFLRQHLVLADALEFVEERLPGSFLPDFGSGAHRFLPFGPNGALETKDQVVADGFRASDGSGSQIWILDRVK